jgi:predicted RNA-binding Zn ribbon-like protein
VRTAVRILQVSRAEPGFQPAGRAPAPPPLDLVQDFVNTEIPVWAQDDIATPGELASWLHARGLLAADASVDAESFLRARALRELLRELGRRNTEHAEPLELSFREEFAAAVSGVRLRVGLDERGSLRLEPEADGVDGALARILSRVLEADATGAWRRMKSCPGAHCGWLFYDGSRNASSTWCSMSICGNRAKTAAYRRRRGAS